MKSIKPIVEKFKDKNIEINISTITETGFDEAKRLTSDVKYLPFEIFLPFWIEKPKVLIVVEAEFWYMLFFIAKLRGAKTLLINARISNKSYPKYLKFKFFYKKIFIKIDKIFCQSEIDKERFLSFGVKNIEVIGNIKLAQNIKITKKYEKLDSQIITAGSTHEGEEELILDSFKKANLKNSKLIIAPRHPERFIEVENIIKSYRDFTFSKFSNDKSFNSEIILLDCLGELINIYAISDIAIIGGTFNENIGGHNPLEPAYFNLKIISGNSYFNQKELYKNVSGINFTTSRNLTEILKADLRESKIIKSINIDEILKAL